MTEPAAADKPEYLWDVQGSYKRPDQAWRPNKRAFVRAPTAEAAIAVWLANVVGEDAAVHQVIRRTGSGVDYWEAPNDG